MGRKNADNYADIPEDVRIITTPPKYDLNERKTLSALMRPLWEIDSRFLNPFKTPVDKPTWLKIGGRPAVPKLGLITIEARPKQGKSYCAYGLSIPILQGTPFDTAEPQDRPNCIIVFDAEMSDISLIPRYKAIRASMSENANNFLIVPMLGTPMAERWGVVEAITEQYQPDIVIIDHIGKFYSDANDQRESTKIVSYLEKLKAERTAIIISHVTTGDNSKLYGAVGTKLDNEQCERYEATIENGIYELKIKSARDTCTDGAASFRFSVSSDGEHNPVRFVDASEKIKAAREKEVEEWRRDFAVLFGDSTELRKGELLERVVRQLNPNATPAEIISRVRKSDTSANNKIKRAFELGIIRKKSTEHTAPYILT